MGLPQFGWACGRVAGPLSLMAFGAVRTALSVALILYEPATYRVFSLGMFFCGIANGSYALTFVVVGASVPRGYIGAAFGFANMAILAVRWPFVSAFDRGPRSHARACRPRCRLS